MNTCIPENLISRNNTTKYGGLAKYLKVKLQRAHFDGLWMFWILGNTSNDCPRLYDVPYCTFVNFSNIWFSCYFLLRKWAFLLYMIYMDIKWQYNITPLLWYITINTKLCADFLAFLQNTVIFIINDEKLFRQKKSKSKKYWWIEHIRNTTTVLKSIFEIQSFLKNECKTHRSTTLIMHKKDIYITY